VVSGEGGPFLTEANLLNNAALGNGFSFAIEYALAPDDQFVRITSSITNTSGSDRQMRVTFQGTNIDIPFGTVALFGATNKVFIPGVAGFDLRWTLPELQAKSHYHLPALPGIVSDFVATQGDGVSYGVFAENDEQHN